MIARLWCFLYGHKGGSLVKTTDMGRHHILTMVCARCQHAYRIEYWDPR